MTRRVVAVIATMLSIAFSASAQWSNPGNSSNVYLTNSNNLVGIGTNTPGEKLHVLGNLLLQGSYLRYSVTDGSTFDLRPGQFGFGLRLKPHSSLGGANRFFQIGMWDNNNVYYPLLHVNESGYLGIGTQTPASRLDVRGTDTSTTTGLTYGAEAGVTVQPATPQASGASRVGFMGWGDVPVASTQALGTVTGSIGSAENHGSGSVSELLGAQGWAYAASNATVSNVIGVGAYSEVDAGTVGELFGADVSNAVYGGNVTNQYGIKINLGASTATVQNKFGLYINNNSGPFASANFGIYQASSTASNFFAGKVGIGNNAPAYPLSVSGIIESSSGGFRFPDGTLQSTAASGSGISTVSAANVTAGTFPSGTFTFPGPLGVGGSASGPQFSTVRSSTYDNEGSAGMYLKSSDNDTALLFGADPTSHAAYISSLQPGVAWTRPLVLNPIGNSVGIGTMAPADVLSIASSIGWGLRVSYRVDNSYLRVSNNQVAAFNAAGASSELWLQNSSQGNTLINAQGGNVGIGTAVPSAKLNLDPQGPGGILIGNPNTASGGFTSLSMGISGASNGYSYLQSTKASGSEYGSLLLNASGGNVGIGSAAPLHPLDVRGYSTRDFDTNPITLGLFTADSYLTPAAGAGVGFMANTGSGSGATTIAAVSGIRESQVDGNYAGALTFGTRANASGGGNMERMRISSSGKVGIGNSNPAQALDVTGAIHATGAITSDSAIYATYQDLAEWVEASEPLEAGTVVVLDPAAPNHVMASTTSYDTSVAGVVSKNPGIVLGRASESKAKVATTGRVKVRVDATAEPIKIGDLLVTSDKAGVAMKSLPMQINGRKFHQPGTVIGKALEPLAGGEGEILVLLSLQ